MSESPTVSPATEEVSSFPSSSPTEVFYGPRVFSILQVVSVNDEYEISVTGVDVLGQDHEAVKKLRRRLQTQLNHKLRVGMSVNGEIVPFFPPDSVIEDAIGFAFETNHTGFVSILRESSDFFNEQIVAAGAQSDEFKTYPVESNAILYVTSIGALVGLVVFVVAVWKKSTAGRTSAHAKKPISTTSDDPTSISDIAISKKQKASYVEEPSAAGSNSEGLNSPSGKRNFFVRSIWTKLRPFKQAPGVKQSNSGSTFEDRNSSIGSTASLKLTPTEEALSLGIKSCDDMVSNMSSKQNSEKTNELERLKEEESSKAPSGFLADLKTFSWSSNRFSAETATSADSPPESSTPIRSTHTLNSHKDSDDVGEEAIEISIPSPMTASSSSTSTTTSESSNHVSNQTGDSPRATTSIRRGSFRTFLSNRSGATGKETSSIRQVAESGNTSSSSKKPTEDENLTSFLGLSNGSLSCSADTTLDSTVPMPPNSVFSSEKFMFVKQNIETSSSDSRIRASPSTRTKESSGIRKKTDSTTSSVVKTMASGKSTPRYKGSPASSATSVSMKKQSSIKRASTKSSRKNGTSEEPRMPKPGRSTSKSVASRTARSGSTMEKSSDKSMSDLSGSKTSSSRRDSRSRGISLKRNSPKKPLKEDSLPKYRTPRGSRESVTDDGAHSQSARSHSVKKGRSSSRTGSSESSKADKSGPTTTVASRRSGTNGKDSHRSRSRSMGRTRRSHRSKSWKADKRDRSSHSSHSDKQDSKSDVTRSKAKSVRIQQRSRSRGRSETSSYRSYSSMIERDDEREKKATTNARDDMILSSSYKRNLYTREQSMLRDYAGLAPCPTHTTAKTRNYDDQQGDDFISLESTIASSIRTRKTRATSISGSNKQTASDRALKSKTSVRSNASPKSRNSNVTQDSTLNPPAFRSIASSKHSSVRSRSRKSSATGSRQNPQDTHTSLAPQEVDRRMMPIVEVVTSHSSHSQKTLPRSRSHYKASPQGESSVSQDKSRNEPPNIDPTRTHSSFFGITSLFASSEGSEEEKTKTQDDGSNTWST